MRSAISDTSPVECNSPEVTEIPRFVFELSHDLKAPLRTIRDSSQLLAKGWQSRSYHDTALLLSGLVQAAERMQRLIDDALTFAVSGSSRESLSVVELSDVLCFTLSNLEAAIREADAVVTFDPLPAVRASFGKIAQVFQNLIENAIKFRSPKQPRIHISCQETRGTWVISVADNGIGLEPKYAEQIFLPLARLHGREQYPGAGLGLAICRRILESYRGQIWVESRAGEGSTFYFTIGGRVLSKVAV